VKISLNKAAVGRIIDLGRTVWAHIAGIEKFVPGARVLGLLHVFDP